MPQWKTLVRIHHFLIQLFNPLPAAWLLEQDKLRWNGGSIPCLLWSSSHHAHSKSQGHVNWSVLLWTLQFFWIWIPDTLTPLTPLTQDLCPGIFYSIFILSSRCVCGPVTISSIHSNVILLIRPSLQLLRSPGVFVSLVPCSLPFTLICIMCPLLILLRFASTGLHHRISNGGQSSVWLHP